MRVIRTFYQGRQDIFHSLEEAVSQNVRSGDSVALEGFTHLIPYAAGHEIIRQGLSDLTLIRMTPDILYDQMIGMGVAARMIFSWGGNPGVGSLHRFRDAIENGWPRALEIEEHSHAAMANAYDAGAANIPFAVFRGYVGVDLPKVTKSIRWIECPYTSERFATVPAIRPDVSIVHAQKADRSGNVLLQGIVGVQKAAVLAAQRAIVTVEEVVESFDDEPTNAVILPHWTIDAVSVVPGGALPSYAQGYYQRQNSFYIKWDPISRDRERFVAWMTEHVLEQDASYFAALARELEAA